MPVAVLSSVGVSPAASRARAHAHELLSAMEERMALFHAIRTQGARTSARRGPAGPSLVAIRGAHRGEVPAEAIRAGLAGFVSELSTVLERIAKQAEVVDSARLIYMRREAELRRLLGVLTSLSSIPARRRAVGAQRPSSTLPRVTASTFASSSSALKGFDK